MPASVGVGDGDDIVTSNVDALEALTAHLGRHVELLHA
jgi:hypothetical protein